MSGLMPPNPLSYEGQVVVPYINRTFPPTTDFINFNVPTVWVDTTTKAAYLLVSKALGIADWIPLGGGGSGTLNTLQAIQAVQSLPTLEILTSLGVLV